jgi:hypothetical protein
MNESETEFDFTYDATQDLLNEGGVVFTVTGAVIAMFGRFDLGPVVVTPGVVKALALHGRGHEPVARMLAPWLLRHAQGDFGRFGNNATIAVTEEQMREGCFVTSDDGTLSAIALRGGVYTMVFSSYADVPGIKDLWVMTERQGPQTTVLLPSEY